MNGGIYVESDHAHTQHGHLELFYVVVYKTDKHEIAGTNNSHLFAHKLFEFSHDHFNIRLICDEAHHQSRAIHFNIRLICMLKPQIFDYVRQKDEIVCWLWASSSG